MIFNNISVEDQLVYPDQGQNLYSGHPFQYEAYALFFITHHVKADTNSKESIICLFKFGAIYNVNTEFAVKIPCKSSKKSRVISG